MRVYLLEDINQDITVFSSYSAMVTHIENNFGSFKVHEYSSKVVGCISLTDDSRLHYKTYDVIGEHSVTTDKIEFK